MALWLRILAAFVNSRSSVPSTHIWQLQPTSCSNFRGSNFLFWSLQASYAHEHTCIHTGKIKLGKQKKMLGGCLFYGCIDCFLVIWQLLDSLIQTLLPSIIGDTNHVDYRNIYWEGYTCSYGNVMQSNVTHLSMHQHWLRLDYTPFYG